MTGNETRRSDPHDRGADPMFRRAMLLHRGGRVRDAEQLYDDALRADPNHFGALYHLGLIRAQQNRLEEAIELLRRALKQNPGSADAHGNIAVALEMLGRPEAALAHCDQAVALRPDRGEAHFTRANVLKALNRLEAAIGGYEQAIALDPGYAEAYYNLGNTLAALKRPRQAVEQFGKALAIRPRYANALNNRGYALLDLERPVEALASFERALAIEPGHPYALSGAARGAAATCDWPRTAKLSTALTAAVAAGKPVNPFTLLAYSSEPSLLYECARRNLRDLLPVPPPPLWQGEIRRNPKIRIAYLSADFHMHPTAYLTAELFELHDRSRFDVLGISFGKDDGSEIRARLVKAFDVFHDVQRKTDAEVAALIHEMQVDIAVDLSGYTKDSRPKILAHRPAPIQVNYLVFPGTMGSEFIDYVIADAIVLPFGLQEFYTEKIVHLPNCYQVNDRKRAVADPPDRRDAGLPPNGLVFCCFNDNYKITPPVFDIWMRLLCRVEQSVLWLYRGNAAAEQNLRREAAARGIDADRLIFAPRVRLEDHLARHRLADLCLDTLPYNAHTTASDALWTGVPLVTCRGRSFAGRVAASLLHAAGLPELVTENLEDYEALALRLAADPSLLRALRDRLQQNRLTYPLFDTDRFRRHIEAAYVTMWEIWQRGERPRSFSIERMRCPQTEAREHRSLLAKSHDSDYCGPP
jgi:protein O-GlcNAc transferase